MVQGSKEWLAGEEPNSGRDVLEIIHSKEHPFIFNAHAHPHILRPGKEGGEFAKLSTAFGQYLKDVLRASHHGVEDTLNELKRHVLMEDVTHGVHKDHSRPRPSERRLQEVFMECHRESVSIPGHPHRLKAFGESFGITVLAALTDLAAPGHRIPGHLGPFDGRFCRHS